MGKVLKFAENMVGVFNLKTGRMSPDINLIEPGRKVVVFNLSEIFGQLQQVDPRDLNGINFDGRVLFFPGKHGEREPFPPTAETPPSDTKE